MPSPFLNHASVRLLELADVNAGVTLHELALYSSSTRGALAKTMQRLYELGMVTRRKEPPRDRVGAPSYAYRTRVRFSDVLETQCPKCGQEGECFNLSPHYGAKPLLWPHRERVLAAVGRICQKEA